MWENTFARVSRLMRLRVQFATRSNPMHCYSATSVGTTCLQEGWAKRRRHRTPPRLCLPKGVAAVGTFGMTPFEQVRSVSKGIRLCTMQKYVTPGPRMHLVFLLVLVFGKVGLHFVNKYVDTYCPTPVWKSWRQNSQIVLANPNGHTVALADDTDSLCSVATKTVSAGSGMWISSCGQTFRCCDEISRTLLGRLW